MAEFESKTETNNWIVRITSGKERESKTETNNWIVRITSGKERESKECRSIVRGESVYLTMLSGHSRHTHSVSVPNISVLLHTHVEAVIKFEVVSYFAHF